MIKCKKYRRERCLKNGKARGHQKSRIPYLSNILTGILISRGSNYIYDLMTKMIQMNWYKKLSGGYLPAFFIIQK